MLSLKINDHTRTFCWGTLAFSLTCDELDVTLNELDLGMLTGNETYWHKLSYNALVAYEKTFNNSANLIGNEIEGLNYYQYVYWLDNSDPKNNSLINESYQNSKFHGKFMYEYYNELIEKINSMNEETVKEPVKKKKERLPK